MYYLFLILLLISSQFQPLVHFPTGDNARISQPFGYKKHVGVDFDVPVGTKVYAVLQGKVILALEDSRVYGRNIIILHDDGYASLYAHLSKLYVSEGETVKAGQVIGLTGGDPKDDIDGDGWSTGAHLHFEIRPPDHLESNLYNIDPIKYLYSFMNHCTSWMGLTTCY